jgi:hypothetical protein
LLVGDSPDPEVTPKAKRRSFRAAYKKKILTEVDAAAGSGGIGEILRREGHLFVYVDGFAEGTRGRRGQRLFSEARAGTNALRGLAKTPTCRASKRSG